MLGIHIYPKNCNQRYLDYKSKQQDGTLLEAADLCKYSESYFFFRASGDGILDLDYRVAQSFTVRFQ